MRVLVTGAAGFIGSNYVHYLVAETDASVVAYDALTYSGDLSNLAGVQNSDRVIFREADVRDRSALDEVLPGVDAVVHFAAESHVDRSIDGPRQFVLSNVEGTQTILEAARVHDVERFVQISTDEVYGPVLEGEADESAPLNPENPYAATKAAADHLAGSYVATYGLPVVLVRPSNNFGPRQHPEKLIPKFVTNALAGDPLPLYGDGSHVREWTFVADTCRAVDLVRREGDAGETYNVGSGERLANAVVAERILEAMDAPRDLLTHVEDRPGHDRRYALDSGRVRALGWAPAYDFDAGLAETVAYYQDR